MGRRGARRHRRGRDDHRRAEQSGRGVLRRGRRPCRADRGRAGAREAPALDHAPQLGLLEGGAAGGDVHARRAVGKRVTSALGLSRIGHKTFAALKGAGAPQVGVGEGDDRARVRDALAPQ